MAHEHDTAADHGQPYRDPSAHGAGGDEFYVHAHVSSVKFYIGILALLMFFTLLTVGVASIHLGQLNLAVAVVIASIKATLVIMFFMHLKYDNKFNATIVVCSLMFIGVFFAYTMNDTDTRAELDDAQGSQVLPSSGVQAPGGMVGTSSPERSHERLGSFYAPGMGDPDEILPGDTVAAPEGAEGAKPEAKPAGEVPLHQ
jgi:cytochrome c oxidase subunit 4